MPEVERRASARPGAADRLAAGTAAPRAGPPDSRGVERAAGDWPVIVVLRFAGGPLAGRSMLAPASIGVLYFYGTTDDGRPDIATSTERGTPVGRYAVERAYDCERTMEHVAVLRWARTAAGAPPASSSR